ncbi:MAG: twin-arginine translocase subunit TatC [Planctomycetota bacterium]
MTDPTTKTEHDSFTTTRMSFGEHLEELRKRLIWAIAGLVAATIVCFNFGDSIIEILTTPYCVAMEQLGFTPHMIQLNPIESFIEYFKISLKFGLVLASPWILYQLWKFVQTGLFPSEQKIVKYFAPSSIFLFVVGATFMVAVVLSGLLKFLIAISMWFPLPSHDNFLYKLYQGKGNGAEIAATRPAIPPTNVPVLVEDPAKPEEGQLWYNSRKKRLNVSSEGETYYLDLQKASSRQFVQPFFSISEYLGFVVNLALAFGFGFQIPIVVVFLTAMRILSARELASMRKYVILGVAILAAILTPTPDVGTMLLLAVPMLLLFEVGLVISRILERRAA